MASKARGPALHPPAGEAWRKAGEWGFDATLLQAASSPDLVVEYRVPGAERGTTQGNALIMVGKTGQATRAGAWIEAAHIAASCPAYDSFVANSPTIGSSGLQLYHFLARAPCAVRSRRCRRRPTSQSGESWELVLLGDSLGPGRACVPSRRPSSRLGARTLRWTRRNLVELLQFRELLGELGGLELRGRQGLRLRSQVPQEAGWAASRQSTLVERP